MDNEILEKINQQVYEQFPYLKDTVPIVKLISDGIHELQFNGSVLTANGHSMPVIVRVVADNQGNIRKLTTSK
jgi:hypothetical protein